jgi:hypothetical protein
MSRYAINPPDEDKYETKPVEDIDVPDFDAPNFAVVQRFLDPPVDPAEHAAHALIDALTTLEQQIVLNYDLERANLLRKMLQRAWQHVDLVSGKAASRVDEILERLR